MWKPGIDRPEPCASSPSMAMSTAGRAKRSTSRDATIPITPPCQSGEASTIARSVGAGDLPPRTISAAWAVISRSTFWRWLFWVSRYAAISRHRSASARVSSSTARRA